jgi:hypothetical protein
MDYDYDEQLRRDRRGDRITDCLVVIGAILLLLPMFGNLAIAIASGH